ncbi:unnamed protein product [Notodromas monacha]|uniref:Vesicle tethering protein Uso1/P115-like head domain-containing protein n=1 Tax=Notodromas monacha TaxID=399045 RepID=A0A7R9GFE7_9CRUS|nr:unnamed protein product [Notodromas monacha]CAG0920623.1 unnamed protein product [Notodromas monacha]
MELFKSGLRSVLGAPTVENPPSGAETVEKLINRARSSTLLDDRRDACRALKALSRKFRMEVGAQGLDVLVGLLNTDRSDSEILGYVLDALCNVTSKESLEEEREIAEVPIGQLEELGERFTEIYLKNPDNVRVILDILDEYDFHVRWPAVKLLTNLILNRPKDLQECILVNPMGVSKFMDLLCDSREVIRNDGLLLLGQLTKGNANIQKIVAFENAFEKLFNVVAEEGYSDGGIVVEDCLHLFLNLLRNNPSNQTFFKEGSYIQKICPFFDIAIPDGDMPLGWPSQKVVNVQLMLQVLQSLISPSRSSGGSGEVLFCQQLMRKCGLLEKMCKLLMTSGVPADVLTEIIHTVGDMIRACEASQEYFAELLVPSNPPQKALVILMMSMVNNKQPFGLRCAVLYVFQCYLYRNDSGKAQIVQTLLPSSTAQLTSVSVGQLLCSGLLSTQDDFSVWCAAVALSHTLVNSPQQKENLLKVHLAISRVGNPVLLLQQSFLILQQATKPQSKLGILMFLSQWLASCSSAVTAFLGLQSAIPFLISQVGSNESEENEDLVQSACAFLLGLCIIFNSNNDPSSNKESLKMLIAKRIGTEKFLDCVGTIGRHEIYAKALKSPQVRYNCVSEPLLDHEFARLHKSFEGMVVSEVSGEALKIDQSERDLNGMVQQLQASMASLQLENDRMKRDLEEARKNALPMLNGTLFPTPVRASVIESDDSGNLKSEIDALKVDVALKADMIHQLQRTLGERDATIEVLQAQKAQETESDNPHNVLKILDAERSRLLKATSELAALRMDQENMMDLLTDYETKISAYARRLKDLGQSVDEEDLDVNEIEQNLAEEANGGYC